MEHVIFSPIDIVSNDEPIELEDNLPFYNPHEFILQKIDEFEELGENWDGYESGPLDTQALTNSRNFVRCMNDFVIEKISDIYPNSHGTISIEWVNLRGEKLCLEIGSSNYSYFIDYLNNEPKLRDGEDIFSATKDIASEVENLVGQETAVFIFN